MSMEDPQIRSSARFRPSLRFRPELVSDRTRQARFWTLGRATLGLLVLGLLWRTVRYLLAIPIWGDEAFLAVHVFIRGFRDMNLPMEYYQVAPVGFLWSELAVSKLLGVSEWALRLLPYLSGILTLVMFQRFTARVLGSREALLAVGILAASFYPVRHSNETKPYASDLALSMVMIAVGWKILDSESPSASDWAALTALGVVGVWCSYPLIFVAAGIGGCLAVRFARIKTAWPGSMLYAVLVPVSWLIFYGMIAPPVAKPEGEFDPFGPTWAGAFPPVNQPWKLPWWLLEIHTGNMLAYPIGGKNFASTATFLLVVRGIYVLWTTRRRMLLGLMLSPLLPTFLAAALEKYPYGTSARISLYNAPAFCLLAGVGASNLLRTYLPSPLVRNGHLRIAMVLAAIPIFGICYDTIVPYKSFDDGEHRRFMKILAGETFSNDRWVAYDGFRSFPKKKNLMLEQWLQQQSEVRFYIHQQAPVPLQWMPELPAIETPEPGGRLWLIVHRTGYENFPEAEASAWLATLTARFGVPARRHFEPSTGQSIDAYVFPPVETPVLGRAEKQNRPVRAEAPDRAVMKKNH